AKVVWDIEHGDSNAAKIDLLMGAISATGLDVQAFHLVGTGLSDVGKSVLHYMQSEGGVGAGAGAIIGGGGKKALAEGEKTTEKTLEEGGSNFSKEEPWKNPDGTFIGKTGSDESKRVLDEVDDANKEAEALANQIVGEGATTKHIIPPKNGSEPGWVKVSADGKRNVTYRPKGLSGDKTENHIANIDINSQEVHSVTKGKNLKIKIPEKKE
ncbi:hypothetical protein, partial [Saccharibacter floricola]|uniref:hypothetical protein n=2 Tax=Saccharibacter floricola TaxID=231053 RepID=UPI000593E5FE